MMDVSRFLFSEEINLEEDALFLYSEPNEKPVPVRFRSRGGGSNFFDVIRPAPEDILKAEKHDCFDISTEYLIYLKPLDQAFVKGDFVFINRDDAAKWRSYGFVRKCSLSRPCKTRYLIVPIGKWFKSSDLALASSRRLPAFINSYHAMLREENFRKATDLVEAARTSDDPAVTCLLLEKAALVYGEFPEHRIMAVQCFVATADRLIESDLVKGREMADAAIRGLSETDRASHHALYQHVQTVWNLLRHASYGTDTPGALIFPSEDLALSFSSRYLKLRERHPDFDAENFKVEEDTQVINGEEKQVWLVPKWHPSTGKEGLSVGGRPWPASNPEIHWSDLALESQKAGEDSRRLVDPFSVPMASGLDGTEGPLPCFGSYGEPINVVPCDTCEAARRCQAHQQLEFRRAQLGRILMNAWVTGVNIMQGIPMAGPLNIRRRDYFNAPNTSVEISIDQPFHGVSDGFGSDRQYITGRRTGTLIVTSHLPDGGSVEITMTFDPDALTSRARGAQLDPTDRNFRTLVYEFIRAAWEHTLSIDENSDVGMFANAIQAGLLNISTPREPESQPAPEPPGSHAIDLDGVVIVATDLPLPSGMGAPTSVWVCRRDGGGQGIPATRTVTWDGWAWTVDRFRATRAGGRWLLTNRRPAPRQTTDDEQEDDSRPGVYSQQVAADIVPPRRGVPARTHPPGGGTVQRDARGGSSGDVNPADVARILRERLQPYLGAPINNDTRNQIRREVFESLTDLPGITNPTAVVSFDPWRSAYQIDPSWSTGPLGMGRCRLRRMRVFVGPTCYGCENLVATRPNEATCAIGTHHNPSVGVRCPDYLHSVQPIDMEDGMWVCDGCQYDTGQGCHVGQTYGPVRNRCPMYTRDTGLRCAQWEGMPLPQRADSPCHTCSHFEDVEGLHLCSRGSANLGPMVRLPGPGECPAYDVGRAGIVSTPAEIDHRFLCPTCEHFSDGGDGVDICSVSTRHLLPHPEYRRECESYESNESTEGLFPAPDDPYIEEFLVETRRWVGEPLPSGHVDDRPEIRVGLERLEPGFVFRATITFDLGGLGSLQVTAYVRFHNPMDSTARLREAVELYCWSTWESYGGRRLDDRGFAEALAVPRGNYSWNTRAERGGETEDEGGRPNWAVTTYHSRR